MIPQNPNAYPYTAVCQLRIHLTIDLGWGTGWLADTSTVVTAAHVLESVDGQKVMAVEALLADGFKAKADTAGIRRHPSWDGKPCSCHDVACIPLKSPIDQDLPSLDFHPPAPPTVGQAVAVSGFKVIPKQDARFKIHSMELTHVDGSLLFYGPAKTDRGESGGPILADFGVEAGLQVIGIHLGGPECTTDSDNLNNDMGLRITPEIAAFIRSCMPQSLV